MYNLFDRYVYVFDVAIALDPRIALPWWETRATLVASRPRTARFDADTVWGVTVRVAVRDTTLRATVARDAFDTLPRLLERDTTLRDATEREGVFAFAVVRFTVFAVALLRGLARPERAGVPARFAWGP